jgi:hypothetical protein
MAMKGFLIFLGICVGLGIFLITSYSKIGMWIVQDVVTQEGTPDAMKDEVAKDENAFANRCRPFLERRALVGRFAQILDEDYFLALAQDTLDRYVDTPLQTTDDYAMFDLNAAVILDQRVKPEQAFALFKRHSILFPNSKDAAMVRSAMNRITLKYGYQ